MEERSLRGHQQINKQEGITVLLAGQDARMALRISQKGYVLVNGEITLSGTATMLQNNEGSEEELSRGITPA